MAYYDSNAGELLMILWVVLHCIVRMCWLWLVSSWSQRQRMYLQTIISISSLPWPANHHLHASLSG